MTVTVERLWYLNASAEVVNHCDTNVWRIGAKSYKLVYILVAHVSHLQRTSNFNITNKRINYTVHTTLCLKKRHCMMLHTITSSHINRFRQFLAQMLLREYVIKWWFVIPPPVTNASALPGESSHEPRKLCLFSHAVYRVSKTTLIRLATSSTCINQF